MSNNKEKKQSCNCPPMSEEGVKCRIRILDDEEVKEFKGDIAKAFEKDENGNYLTPPFCFTLK